jgi:hypothetical protein
VTDLPVIDPSAACSPFVAAELRIDLESARTGQVQWSNDGGAALNAAAGALQALDDDALLESFRRFIDRGGVIEWLWHTARPVPAPEAAGPEPEPEPVPAPDPVPVAGQVSDAATARAAAFPVIAVIEGAWR